MPKVEERRVYKCSCPDCARMSGGCKNLYVNYGSAYAKEQRCPMRLSNKFCSTCKYFEREHKVKYTKEELEKLGLYSGYKDEGMYCKKRNELLGCVHRYCMDWEKKRFFWEPDEEELKRYAEFLNEEEI